MLTVLRGINPSKVPLFLRVCDLGGLGLTAFLWTVVVIHNVLWLSHHLLIISPLKPSGVTSEPNLESTIMPLSLQGSLMPLQY